MLVELRSELEPCTCQFEPQPFTVLKHFKNFYTCLCVRAHVCGYAYGTVTQCTCGREVKEQLSKSLSTFTLQRQGLSYCILHLSSLSTSHLIIREQGLYVGPYCCISFSYGFQGLNSDYKVHVTSTSVHYAFSLALLFLLSQALPKFP